MNLLNDKRDRDEPKEIRHIDPVPSVNFENETNENQKAKNAFESEKKPRNSLGAFFMIILIFVLAVIVTYFGFYKPRQYPQPEYPL